MIRNTNPYSSLWGILEGKRKKVVEDEKRKTAEKQAELKLKTADVDQAAAQTALSFEKLKADTTTKTYVIIGLAVVAVMAGLYFIVKR